MKINSGDSSTTTTTETTSEPMLKKPVELNDPWSKAEATAEKNPTFESNPLKSSQANESSKSSRTTSLNDTPPNMESDVESDENPSSQNPTQPDPLLIKQAAQSVAFFINPLMRIFKKPPLSDEECRDLGEPLVQILPAFCFHPAIRALGVGSQIIYRRSSIVEGEYAEPGGAANG